MVTYTQKTTPNGWEYIERINEDESVSQIPIDPANSDYQQYLKEMNK